MATAKELLIDPFVAGAAIARRQMSADYESVMIDFLLAGGGLVAIEAIDTLLRMSRHFVFVDHRILEPRMALCALAGCTNEVGCRLGCLDSWGAVG